LISQEFFLIQTNINAVENIPSDQVLLFPSLMKEIVNCHAGTTTFRFYVHPVPKNVEHRTKKNKLIEEC